MSKAIKIYFCISKIIINSQPFNLFLFLKEQKFTVYQTCALVLTFSASLRVKLRGGLYLVCRNYNEILIQCHTHQQKITLCGL